LGHSFITFKQVEQIQIFCVIIFEAEMGGGNKRSRKRAREDEDYYFDQDGEGEDDDRAMQGMLM